MDTIIYKITNDHDEIQTWVEEHRGEPALINLTENAGEGILSLQFGDDPTLLPISWQEFFDRFDSAQLSFRYEVTTLHPTMFSYAFLDHAQAEADEESTEEDDTEMPEDDIPAENIFPSAPSEDFMNYVENEGQDTDTL